MTPPPGCPRRGTPFTRELARRLMGLAGWRVEGSLPDEPRFVAVVAPHTSNWDFLVCILSMFATGLRLSWLAKHSLFRFPVRSLLRWLGGEPIDRTATRGTVEIAIARFREREQWVLGISPEGTRRRAEQWKTGFHRIAVGAGVPILPIWIDYSRRVLGLGALVRPTADINADLAVLRAVFRKEMARYPAKYTEPVVAEAGDGRPADGVAGASANPPRTPGSAPSPPP